MDLLAEPIVIFWEIGWKVAVVIADIFGKSVVYILTTFRHFSFFVPNLPRDDFIHFIAKQTTVLLDSRLSLF